MNFSQLGKNTKNILAKIFDENTFSFSGRGKQFLKKGKDAIDSLDNGYKFSISLDGSKLKDDGYLNDSKKLLLTETNCALLSLVELDDVTLFLCTGLGSNPVIHRVSGELVYLYLNELKVGIKNDVFKDLNNAEKIRVLEILFIDLFGRKENTFEEHKESVLSISKELKAQVNKSTDQINNLNSNEKIIENNKKIKKLEEKIAKLKKENFEVLFDTLEIDKIAETIGKGKVSKKDDSSSVWREMVGKFDMLIESMNGSNAYLYINTDEYNNLMNELISSREQLIHFMRRFYDFSAKNC